MATKDKREVDDTTKHQYFLYIRDLLWARKLYGGQLYTIWCTQQINTLEEMCNFTKGTVHTPEEVGNILPLGSNVETQGTIDADINPGSDTNQKPQKFRILGDISSYSKISYTIIKTLWNRDFYQVPGSVTTYTRYCNLIDNLLKNMYNCLKTPESQKSIIKKDKKLNFLILGILQHLGIIEDNPSDVEFNQGRIDSLKMDFANLGTGIVDTFKTAIERVLHKQ